MSDLKLCQGSRCHTYHTKDRLKGMKGSKTYQTRRRSYFYYGNGNFCSMNCWNDWFNDFGDNAINYFGRTTEPKHLTEENAWVKYYDYRSTSREEDSYFYINKITTERRPITQQQYDDNSYDINI
jgi:hypothetical protein|tara:strand:+ start:239 stop:613 length:375 start_codon:yes stop_codon:yes gene_type:complete